MLRRFWFLQEGEDGGEGGKGGGGGGVDAGTARTFLADFAHDAEALKALPDDQVVAWHGRVSAGIDKVRPAGGKWPDKWREELAAGDEKASKRLERFASPGDIFKSFRALEQRMSSGELKANVPFPEKGTDDEKNAWRKDQGVPDKADGYFEKLPDGLVIGEDDKATMTKFAERMHSKHAPPALVHEAIAGYYAAQEEAVAERAAADKEFARETEDALRAEWGNEYRGNVDRLKAFLGNAGELGDRLMSARLSDGRPLFADPAAAKFFMGIVNEIEPAVTLVPGAGGNQTQAIADELSNLRKMMGDQKSDYWSKDKGPALQERYRKLLEGQAKISKKAA